MTTQEAINFIDITLETLYVQGYFKESVYKNLPEDISKRIADEVINRFTIKSDELT